MRKCPMFAALLSATCFVSRGHAQDNPLDPNAGPKYPAWLKPGTRLTYSMGSGVAPGGKRLNVPGETDAAGAGVVQVTILGADARGVAAEEVTFNLFEATSDTVQSGKFSGLLGSPHKLGNYWIDPASLAQTPDRNDQAAKTWHLKWRIGEREVDAIGFQNADGAATSRYIYQIDSGLLLNYHSDVVHSPRPGTPEVNGVVTMSLVNVRETKLPWADTPVPAWVKNGGKLVMSGQWAFMTPGVPALPGQVRETFTFGEPSRQYVGASGVHEQVGFNGASPDRAEYVRCFGGGAGLPLWLDPRTLQNVQPGAMFDTDPITRHTLRFLGRQGNFLQLAYENPGERLVQTYDPNTGMTVGIDATRKAGAGSVDIHLRTEGQ